MKGLLLSIFVFCALFATAYSLKCYSCLGTEDKCSKMNLEANKDSKTEDCPFDKCMRIWGKNRGKTVVLNSCSSSVLCAEFKKDCDNIKEGECVVGCCDSDYCNEGSSVSLSVILMIVSSALGLALLK